MTFTSELILLSLIIGGVYVTGIYTTFLILTMTWEVPDSISTWRRLLIYFVSVFWLPALYVGVTVGLINLGLRTYKEW